MLVLLRERHVSNTQKRARQPQASGETEGTGSDSPRPTGALACFRPGRASCDWSAASGGEKSQRGAPAGKQ